MPDRILVESKLDPTQAALREVVAAGDPWIHLVKKGEVFRIVDLCGNQAADTLFYSAADTHEHYSAQNTIQSQGNIYLTNGSVLRSNRGRSMQRIGKLLRDWDPLGEQAALQRRLQKRLDPACAKLPAGDSRTLCDGLFKPAAAT